MHGANVFRQACQLAPAGAELTKVGEVFQQAVRLAGKARVVEFQDRDLVQEPF
ncbi:hypothetical protein D3C87_1851890 [compost metagenome]